MTFTQEAWARNSALFQATLEMPFNRELPTACCPLSASGTT